MAETVVENETKLPKQGKIPKGIVTTKDLEKSKPKPKPKGKTATVMYDEPTLSDAPRNVYRETATGIDGRTEEWIWWHCEDGSYVGKKYVTKKKDRFSERMLVTGYEYNIPCTPENLKKVAALSTNRTKFYTKYRAERKMLKNAEEFVR